MKQETVETIMILSFIFNCIITFCMVGIFAKILSL